MDYNTKILRATLTIFILAFSNTVCVKINNLIVPSLISTLKSPIILDCDYSVELPKDEGLVVKWFFNDTMYPVYQWIPSDTLDTLPQGSGILKGRLDLNYKASEERYKKYRALKIVKIGPELEGNFTCYVSTYTNEDSQTKHMSILVPQKTLELKYPPLFYQSDEKNAKILCYAEEIFPKPELRLFLNNIQIKNATLRYFEKNNGLFDAEIFTTASNLTNGTIILCELYISFANYSVRKAGIYYEVWGSSSNTLNNGKIYHLLDLRIFYGLIAIFLYL